MRVASPKSGDATPMSLIGAHYAPQIGAAAMEFSRVTYAHSKLSLREFEAARMITAHLNGCMLCQNWRSATDLPLYLKSLGEDEHAEMLGKGDVPDDAFYQGIAGWRTSSLYSPRERIAIEMAERMGTEPKIVAQDEDFWQRAKALFSDAELIDLGYCVACWMGLGRMTHVFGLDSACGLPSAIEAQAA